MIGAPGPETARCSRAACSSDAVWSVHWRNPRIHGADRVKTWLACDEHIAYLRDYLLSRDFPVTVTPHGVTIERVGVEPAVDVTAAADGEAR